ncbi:uncharacterized protein LOC132737442 [Ruditapes philippinarum]|uniref:uncharacterized protein LOC132737442 n=1 Tax=Ruditapes philippinarum TaxID=129788 RepID=UPI00295BB69B|nr:uncharacterized protein LOC132737442 [Ruditapes philippinarum]
MDSEIIVTDSDLEETKKDFPVSSENISSDCADAEEVTKPAVLNDAGNANEGGTEKAACQCDPCLLDNTQVTACAFCIVCVEYLCKNCCRDHRKHKTTRDHELLLENIPDDPKIFKHIRRMVSCPIHSDIDVTHKCVDHNTHICCFCLADSHRKCENVCRISDAITSSGNTVSQILLKIKQHQVDNQQMSSTKSLNVLELTTEKNNVKVEASEIVKQCTSELVAKKTELVNETDLIGESYLKALKDDVSKCKALEDECKLLCEIIETIDQYGNEIEKDTILMITQEKLDLMDQEKDKLRKREPMHLNFIKNKECFVVSDFGKLQIRNLANENVLVKDEDNSYVLEEVAKGESSTCANEKDNNAQPDRFTVKIGDDFYSCSITGCVILDDGIIVVIDEENRKIKVFDSDFIFLSGNLLTAPPIDICITDINTAAIIYKVAKRIDFKQINVGVISHYRELPTKFEISRITASPQYQKIALLYSLGFTSRNNIQIRNVGGKIIHEISLDNSFHFANREEFGICYIECNLVIIGRSIGVSLLVPAKFNTYTLIPVMALGDDIDVTRHISSDANGNIYICAPASGCVYHFLTDREKPVVLKATVPLSVARDHNRNRIIVGCFGSNTVDVLQQ